MAGYNAVGTEMMELHPVTLSLRVAGLAVLVDVPLAMCCAWLLARYRFPGRIILDGLCHLPLVLPPVVVGLMLLYLFGANGPIGRLLEQGLGVRVTFHWTGAVLAAAIMAFPLVLRSIRQGIERLDTDLEQAAATLGAPPLWSFLTLTLPLLWPAILTGTVLGFGRALGEFGATIMLAGNIQGKTQTIATAIYSLAHFPGQETQLWTLAAISAGLAFASVAGSEWLAGKFRPARKP